MSNDPELYKKLVDDDDDVEEQLKKPLVPSAAKPKSRSIPCVCKCLMITAALFTVFGLFAGGAVYMMTKNVVEHFTVTTPSPQFPVVHMTDAEMTVVEDRVALFVDSLIAGGHPLDDLTLTQDEINGFLGSSDYLRGNMMITLSKNAIKEEYSLPMDMVPGGSGRFFVGSDYVKVNEDKKTIEMEMETAATHKDWFDGPLLFAQLEYLVAKNKKDEGKTMLELFLTKGSIFGQDAPQEFIDQRENLLHDLYDNADCEDAKAARTIIAGIERVAIEEGKIVVKPRKD